MATMTPASPAEIIGVERPSLKRERSARARFNTTCTVVTWIMAILASVPLISVLYMLITRGGSRLSFEVLTALPPTGFMDGGGVGPAIVGTLVMVGIASAISIPIGILAAIFLGFLSPDSKVAAASRFLAKAMTGLPSIIAGIFIYLALVRTMGSYSALAGGISLSVLMLPTVILTAEQAARMVPQRMKDAAYGIGCTQAQTAIKVVLPTALPGIMTGIMLAIAGAAGESAPLLFTALFSSYYLTDLVSPTASLSILIYNFSGMPFPNQIELAWTASLILVLIVLVFNILSRLFGQKKV